MQDHNLDSLKHFIKHVMSNTLKLQNLRKKALRSETQPQITCYYPIKSQLIRNYLIKSQF